ncbi:hypothetical protein [Kitasatospora sp. NBC_00315]|uniref:SCO6745 family protein n=1 Tax=Kitasatospora sp. NBC_00315 TaxID=2975963 RepID=UPI00324836BA
MPVTTDQAVSPRPLALRRARALRDALEPYHAVIILAPQATEVFREIGLTSAWAPYYAGRIAPLGAVRPAVVDAVFYHFNPRMAAREIPQIWAVTTPEVVLAARLVAADRALRDLLGDRLIGSDALADAAALAARAAAACTGYGRPLGAANSALPLPAEPHLALWQAATTLREYRGDGHHEALLHLGLDPVEALVTITAAGGERRASIQARREWSDTDWEAAEQRLAARGLLAADGTLTPEGRTLREEVEDATDRLAAAPWQAIGTDDARRLHEAAAPLGRRIVERLGLPFTLGDFPVE